MAAGKTVSFIAEATLEQRVAEIASTEGVTRSQAAARSFALGSLPPTAARRAARFILEQGDDDAKRQLALALAKAIARTSNAVLERTLLAKAEARAPVSTASDEQLEAQAVEAVAAYRKAGAG